tara:strand:- start:752 stop:3094 length:2343 start_codon:yes stop_codon:yes gene_type:complete
VAKKARKVISKECEEAVDRMLAAIDSVPDEFVEMRPDIIRSILNNGGTREWTVLSTLTSLYSNSMLGSSGMFVANVFSAMGQAGMYVPNSMIRNGVVNTMAAHYALLGKDAQLMTNMARYFSAALKSGLASDVADINLIARQRGVSKEEIVKQAKQIYVQSWIANDSSLKDIDVEKFIDSINLTDEEVSRIFTDIEFMTNQKVPYGLGWTTIPQKIAVAVDESAKVYFRLIKLSETARKLAIKDASSVVADSSEKKYVDELHAKYFKEIMDVHNARYQGEYGLAAEQTKGARFRAVRQASLALEKKSNKMFKDLFSEEDIPYEDIREFALNMTFQRRLPVDPNAPLHRRLPNIIAGINREKSKLGKGFTLGEELTAATITSQTPFTKTPYNIAVDGMSYTPIAMIPFMRPKQLKKKMKEGKVVYEIQDYDDYLVRVAIGTSIMLPLGVLFMTANEDGMPFITGTSKDAEERKLWQQSGIPEKSVLIDGTYVSYDRLEPMGTYLGMYTDYWEGVMRFKDYEPNDPEYNKAAVALDEAAIMLLNATANKTVLESAVSFLDYFRYNNQGLSGGLKQLGTDVSKGFIPTGVSDLARIIDGQERLARTPMEQVQQRIPFLREQLPLDTSRVSGVSTKESNWAEIILKLKATPITNQTEVQRYIYRTQANIPVVDSKFMGIKLNTAETSLLREITLPYVDRQLGALVASQMFQNEDAFVQKRLLEREASRASHPGVNEGLLAEFIQEGNKRFGASWLQSLDNRKWNQKVREKGLNLMVGFKDVEEF